MEHKDLVPLKWPDGWGRTLLEHRKTRSQWKKPYVFYREQVIKELEKLGASAVTISRQEPAKERMDPGVAVWFSLKPHSDFSWQTGLHLDNPVPSLDEIDSAFRKLAQKHHPDAVNNGSGGDVQVFHRLSEYRKQARAWVLGGDAQALDNCIPCDKFTDARQNLAGIASALRHFRGLPFAGSAVLNARSVRHQLSPLHRSLLLLFGEINKVEDVPIDGQRQGSNSAWDTVKQRLAPRLREAVDILLTQRTMKRTQLAAAMKMDYSNCTKNVVGVLLKQGLLIDNGKELSLKEL